MTQTEVEVEVSEEVEVAIKELLNSKIILWNDNVNTFEYVILCLIEYFKHTIE